MTVNLEEYFRTTFEDRLLVKMPEREDDHLTPATRMLEKRREMAEVDQALAAQKEEFQMKMESLQQRREELERKEHQLKESLLKFDKFLKSAAYKAAYKAAGLCLPVLSQPINASDLGESGSSSATVGIAFTLIGTYKLLYYYKENDSKRARAIKKANDERELKKQKDKDIDRVKDETSLLQEQKEHLQKKLDKYTPFQQYMDKVLEAGQDFHEIRDIITRWDTLTATHADLLERDQRNHERIEKQRQDLMKYLEEKENQVLHYNNQLSGLQMRLDIAQSEAVKWESRWTHINTTAAKKTLLLGRIKMATHNLYQLVKSHQNQLDDVEDTAEQLTQIQQFVQDLNQITTEIKKMEHTGTSIIPPSSS